MKWTYKSEYVRCGKSKCKSCPHGPYWYRYAHTAQGMRKEYVGKGQAPPPEERDQLGKEHYHDLIFSRRTATAQLAREILGNVAVGETKKGVTKAFWRLCRIHHPDKGGNTRVMQRIAAAYAYLRVLARS